MEPSYASALYQPGRNNSLPAKHRTRLCDRQHQSGDEYTRNKIRLNFLPLMQEINPSVKNTLIDTSNYLNDVATIYNKCIEETKKKIITAEGIRICDLVKEPAPEAILFEVLHPLGFNSAQIKDITHSLHSQPGKQFCSKEWRVIKDREFLLIETAESENETLLLFKLSKKKKNTPRIFSFHVKRK